MGKSNRSFEHTVLHIVRKHFPTFNKRTSCKKRFSRNANYLALTITVYAASQEQLDALYQDLSNATEVIMAL